MQKNFEGLIMQIKITVDVGNFLEIFYWPSKYVEKKSVLVLVCVCVCVVKLIFDTVLSGLLFWPKNKK